MAHSHQYYTTLSKLAIGQCTRQKFLQCTIQAAFTSLKFRKGRIFITCISQLQTTLPKVVRFPIFFSKYVVPHILELTHDKLLVYKTEFLVFNCKEGTKQIPD